MTSRAWGSYFHRRWMAATLAALVGVLTLTHIPQDALPPALQKNTLDKVEHIAAYGLIAAFFLLSLRKPVRLVLALTGLAILAAIAALDELTQPLVNRQAGIGDYLADLVGMLLAGAAYLILKQSRRRIASS